MDGVDAWGEVVCVEFLFEELKGVNILSHSRFNFDKLLFKSTHLYYIQTNIITSGSSCRTHWSQVARHSSCPRILSSLKPRSRSLSTLSIRTSTSVSQILCSLLTTRNSQKDVCTLPYCTIFWCLPSPRIQWIRPVRALHPRLHLFSW